MNCDTGIAGSLSCFLVSCLLAYIVSNFRSIVRDQLQGIWKETTINWFKAWSCLHSDGPRRAIRKNAVNSDDL
jgi:hypothetical protein